MLLLLVMGLVHIINVVVLSFLPLLSILFCRCCWCHCCCVVLSHCFIFVVVVAIYVVVCCDFMNMLFTITFVLESFPRGVFSHLSRDVRKLTEHK